MRLGALRAILGLGAAAFFLAGCVGQQLEVAKGMSGPDDKFGSLLYKGYIALSQSEFDEGDYVDADLFANRAIMTAGGTVPGPQPVGERQLPADQAGDVEMAYQGLAGALQEGAEKFPKLAALAQTSFDCWVQELEENIQPDHIARCREDFSFAKDALVAALTPPPPKPEPKLAARLYEKFVILFDLESADVSADGQKTINKAVMSIDQHGAKRVVVSGFTDRSGSDAYNQKLSQKRAENVAAVLQENSSTDLLGLMEVKAYGEERNAVPTADGKWEPKNRRVKIDVIR